MPVTSSQASSPPPARRWRATPLGRLLLLLACLGAGGLIGYAGHALSGATAWYLAIPAVVAAGWLAVADPSRCQGGGCALGQTRLPGGDV